MTKTVTGELHRVRRSRATGFDRQRPGRPGPQPARVAVMLALAHKIQEAIDAGKLKDMAEAARRLGLTRARVSQLLDLTLLAPDIQERLLFGQSGWCERTLRRVSETQVWRHQRLAFCRDAPEIRSVG
jgi:hypothetical protein